MNKRRYNNIIFGTLKQQKTIEDEPLTMVRKICKNMGVALPQGDCKEVLETLRVGGFMAWKKCSKKEVCATANSGMVTIAISDSAIAIIPADEQGTFLMPNNQNDTSFIVTTLGITETDDVEYYFYNM